MVLPKSDSYVDLEKRPSLLGLFLLLLKIDVYLSMILTCGAKLLNISTPHIMGILNVTPDSFSDGGRYYPLRHADLSGVLARGECMVREGASIIDVGGESTRPGAKPVTLQEEMDRVLPVVEAITQRLDIVISIDTSQAQVMTESILLGAGLINDVRALRLEGALNAVAQSQASVCLMHMQGNPATMQHNPEYRHCVNDVVSFLNQRIKICEAAGISSDRILVDPGIGFGKKDEHNLELINALSQFKAMGAGLLFGVSRKSMIGRLLGRDLPERLPGSLALALVALQRGAKILRVHDVAATADIVKIYQLTRV